MGRIRDFSDRVVQQHLLRDVLACEHRFRSAEQLALHLYSSDLRSKCRYIDLCSFESEVRSILLQHGDPIWRFRLIKREPIQFDPESPMLEEDKEEEEDDEDIIDEDDDDLDGYIEEEDEKEEDLELFHLFMNTDDKCKKKMDDGDTAGDDSDDTSGDDDAEDSNDDDDADADADMLLEGVDAQPPMFKDLVGMDAVAVLKAGFFNVPFKMSRIFLRGPPGCAITNLAHSISCETQISFYQISGASQLENIRDLFSKAYQSTEPSIVFIHDLDAVGAIDLMMCMDKFHRPGYILVIGATSKPHAINPTLMYFGHFDCDIALTIPDENNARVQILSVLAHEMEKLTITTPDFQVPPSAKPSKIGENDRFSCSPCCVQGSKFGEGTSNRGCSLHHHGRIAEDAPME